MQNKKTWSTWKVPRKPKLSRENSIARIALIAGVCSVQLLAASLVSCFPVIPSFAGEKMISAAPLERMVTALLEMQADAWNKGDLDKFMSGYLKSKDISYTSGGNEVWGYDAIQTRYKNRYGSNKSQMGHLKFSALKISELGPKNAMCIGHWHLILENNSPQKTSESIPQETHQNSPRKIVQSKEQQAMDGVFTLILSQDATGGWKIIHDHTSLNQKPSDLAKKTDKD